VYYHSVVPVVLASSLFVLVNYFLVPVAVLVLCLIAVAVCGNGDVSHALSSMRADDYALQPGFAKLAICALVRAGHSRPAFFFHPGPLSHSYSSHHLLRRGNMGVPHCPHLQLVYHIHGLQLREQTLLACERPHQRRLPLDLMAMEEDE